MKNLYKIIFTWQFYFLPFCCSYAQKSGAGIFSKYDYSFQKLSKIINGNLSFKQAVIISENIFYDTQIDTTIFYNEVKKIIQLSNLLPLNSYASSKRIRDSTDFKNNNALYNLLTNTNYFYDNIHLYISYPFEYNFTDPQGNQDWTNTFVTKLLATHKGNCRSLTYLYKILADELGAKCWLALAPNHIYIRNYSKQIGWYNTELTSGTFPTDAWIAATGYVNTDAIRSGVYMDTLSNQQSIGLCIMDLAQGYIKQTNNYTDSFVLKCCNLVLQYHSVNPEALLTKAEVLKRMYLKQKEENKPTAQDTYNEMEQTYITLVKLGYREMPYKTYQKWLKTAKQDKEKYQNKKLNHVTQKD